MSVFRKAAGVAALAALAMALAAPEAAEAEFGEVTPKRREFVTGETVAFKIGGKPAEIAVLGLDADAIAVEGDKATFVEPTRAAVEFRADGLYGVEVLTVKDAASVKWKKGLKKRRILGVDVRFSKGLARKAGVVRAALKKVGKRLRKRCAGVYVLNARDFDAAYRSCGDGSGADGIAGFHDDGRLYVKEGHATRAVIWHEFGHLLDDSTPSRIRTSAGKEWKRLSKRKGVAMRKDDKESFADAYSRMKRGRLKDAKAKAFLKRLERNVGK